MKRIRRRLAREDGMTLTELLMAASVGTIVIMAAYMALDRSTTLSNEIADRSDALQRGRMTLELMSRQLRSQVCLGDAIEPITDGRDHTVSFYADTSDGTIPVQQRKLTYHPTATTINGQAIPAKSLTEERYIGQGTYPDLTFPGYPGAPDAVRVLGQRHRPVRVNNQDQPIFSYWAWDDAVGAASGSMEELPRPLSTADVSRTVMVRVRFVSEPAKTKVRDQDSVTLSGEAYVRSADPSQPKEGPRCL